MPIDIRAITTIGIHLISAPHLGAIAAATTATGSRNRQAASGQLISISSRAQLVMACLRLIPSGVAQAIALDILAVVAGAVAKALDISGTPLAL